MCLLQDIDFVFVNFSNEESYVAIRDLVLMHTGTKAFATAEKETKWEACTEKALEHEYEEAPEKRPENQRRRKSVYLRQISSDSSEDGTQVKGNCI